MALVKVTHLPCYWVGYSVSRTKWSWKLPLQITKTELREYHYVNYLPSITRLTGDAGLIFTNISHLGPIVICIGSSSEMLSNARFRLWLLETDYGSCSLTALGSGSSSGVVFLLLLVTREIPKNFNRKRRVPRVENPVHHTMTRINRSDEWKDCSKSVRLANYIRRVAGPQTHSVDCKHKSQLSISRIARFCGQSIHLYKRRGERIVDSSQPIMLPPKCALCSFLTSYPNWFWGDGIYEQDRRIIILYKLAGLTLLWTN